jgi:hypothetical protein
MDVKAKEMEIRVSKWDKRKFIKQQTMKEKLIFENILKVKLRHIKIFYTHREQSNFLEK